MDAAKTGELIARARREKGMTQKELADKLHVSNKAVSRWETGAGFPDVSSLEPLAAALDLTVTALLSGVEDGEPAEELVRESTRHFSGELRQKLKRYRWICAAAFVCAALIVGAAILISSAVRRQERRTVTTISCQETTEKENALALATGGSTYYFDTVRADNVKGMTFTLELWTADGLQKTWDMMGVSGFGEVPGTWNAPLIVSVFVKDNNFSDLDVCLYYNGGRVNVPVEIPYETQGALYAPMTGETKITAPDSVILLEYNFYAGTGVRDRFFLGRQPSIEPGEGEVILLLRESFT